MISTAVIMSALELGFIYALVALALFLSFRVLNAANDLQLCSFQKYREMTQHRKVFALNVQWI